MTPASNFPHFTNFEFLFIFLPHGPSNGPCAWGSLCQSFLAPPQVQIPGAAVGWGGLEVVFFGGGCPSPRLIRH